MGEIWSLKTRAERQGGALTFETKVIPQYCDAHNSLRLLPMGDDDVTRRITKGHPDENDEDVTWQEKESGL